MQANPTRSIIEQQNEQDDVLLNVLIATNNHRPFSEDEIARALERDPDDSLRRLYAGGLIHRLNGYVWASTAAVMADEIHE